MHVFLQFSVQLMLQSIIFWLPVFLQTGHVSWAELRATGHPLATHSGMQYIIELRIPAQKIHNEK